MKKIGFIGLGVMGKPMAGHLVSTGFEVFVHSRTRTKVHDLVAKGANAMPPEQMSASCDAVLLCLPASQEVSEITHHLLSGARSGLIICDHSTIQPRVARNLAERASQFGVTFLDAPITGGEVGAISGNLSTMVGGDERAYQKARPVLEAFSSKVTYMGPAGNGQMTKMANQIAVAVTIMAVAETLSFAEQNELDLGKVLDVISGGAGDSWSLRFLGPKMIEKDYKPGFATRLQLKDLAYAIEAAQAAGSTLPGLALTHQFAVSQMARGLGEQSVASLIELYRSLNGDPAR